MRGRMRQSRCEVPFFLERSSLMFVLRILFPVLCAVAVLLVMRPAGASASPEITEQARKFLDEHTKKLQPLEVAAALAWWNANISGKDEDFQVKIKTQNQ